VFRQRLLVILPIVLIPLAVCRDSRVQESLRLLAEADRLALLYNWHKAAPLYAQAESLFVQSGDKRNALFARFGYFWATADSGVNPGIRKEVATHLQDPLVQADPRLMLRGLVTQAVLDRNSNEIAAREPWAEIMKLAKTLGDKTWEDRAKAEIAQISYMDGNLRSAAEMIREALISQYLRLDLGAALYYTAMVCNGFAATGRPETGLQYCDRVFKLARFANDMGFPFLAYQGKAAALIALNRNAEAESVLKEALVRAREEHNYFALSQLLVIAGMAAASHDSATAIENLREAIDVSHEKGFRHVFVWSTFQLAEVYRNVGNLNDAELLVSRSIEIMRALEDRYHLPHHLTLLADLKARKGEFERADELYSESADVIDALLVNVNAREVKGSLIATLSESYVGHFELAATKFSDPDRAYQIIEQARGRSLADTLRGESETLSSSDEISLEAQKEINRIQLALLHNKSRDERESLLDQLFRMEQRLSPVRKTSSPLGSASDRPKPVPLRTLQASLRPDEMLLEYVLGETQSYCLQITRAGAAVVVLPASRRRIEDLVDEYLATVRSRQPETVVAKELFSLLLQPVIGDESRTRATRLIIVSDGKLHLLPFDALRDSVGRYVLESHTVTYAPSATVLHLLRQSPVVESLPLSLAGVGGAIYSGTVADRTPVEVTAANLFGLEGVTFPELPGSKQEVQSIGSIIKGPNELLLDTNATEAAFKALALENFRILHLAVHGVANTEFPDRAALVMGGSRASLDDGLLQVREIRDLRLRAILVVLSACETGSGKLLGAEGIASLERAFLLAGAKSVVASLWTADDIFTIALMKRFYEHLASGTDTGSALRQAKLDLIQQFGDQAIPIYWAGFTLVGEGGHAVFR
jgi:CHAT domain-containing protein